MIRSARLLLTVILLAVHCVLLAETPARERALEIASSFFASNSPMTKGAENNLSLVYGGENGPFIFERENGGFIIISDEGRVIGFSFENDFFHGDIPEEMNWWMDNLNNLCESQRGQVVAATLSPVSNEYKDVRTNQWHQSYPFFSKVPKQNDNRCQAGCLPIALAEIMCQFATQKEEYRVKGDGSTVGGYTVLGSQVAPAAYTLDTEYRWTDFMYGDVSGLEEDVLDNLAQLVLDCGALVRAGYSTWGTAADENNVVQAFGDHMSYNKGAHWEFASFYTPSEWTEMMVDEMNAGRPLLYCGYSSSGGHAYVADGYATYQGETVIHFNFGWSGSGNGYYWSYHQNPQSYDFNSGLKALFDFYPNPGGSYPQGKLYFPPGSNGITVKKSTKWSGYWDYIYDGFRVSSPGGFTGRICLFKISKDGTKTQFMSPVSSYTYQYGKDLYLEFVTSEPTGSFGDKLALYYETSPYSYEWLPFGVPIDGSTMAEPAIYPAAFIRTESSYSRGDKFELRLINTNYAYEDYYTTTKWSVTTPSGNTKNYNTADREFTLDQSGTWTIQATVSDTTSGAVKDKIITTIKVQ